MDELTEIVCEACENNDITDEWVPFITDLVGGTNAIYGSAGKFDPNVATDYAEAIASNIRELLDHGKSSEHIRTLDFITIYNAYKP